MKLSERRAPELLVTCLGLGYAPVASGTFGTLAGIALAGIAGWFAPGFYLPLMVVLAVAATAASVAAGPWAERFYGRKDPSAFVLDEVAGFLVAAAWPAFPGWSHLVLAFLLFRWFDVWKPWPANSLQSLPHGWGIVMDDIAAGAWALLVLVGLRAAFPGFIGV
ncbi:MAG TPA: phosphatidylglycerophosphatase A [Planctomycetota bacterium]